MLSKTRTTIITAVAAFSFGGAAIVPTAAQARQKKPGPHLSKKACTQLKQYYDDDILSAKEAETQESKDFWTQQAFTMLYAAEQGGCSWAKALEAARPESTPSQIAPEAPPKRIRPEGPPPPAK